MDRADDNMPPTKRKKVEAKSLDGKVVAFQLLDTGWRVALPILLLSYVGIRLDRHYDTKPLYTLIGFFLSLAVATLLVYRQISELYPDFFKSGKGAAK